MEKPSPKVDMVGSIPFFAMHVGAVVGLFFFSITPAKLLFTLGVYFFFMAAVTIGYHRYFSHRTFKTSRAFQFILALWATMTLQKGALWWAANHRHHHRHSDEDEDIHSPTKRGFWWSHTGWIIVKDYVSTNYEAVRDLSRFPELVWLNKHFLIPGIAYAVAVFAIGGWELFYFGFVLSHVLLWHGTFTINSLTHVWGKRRFVTTDTSRNNVWLALITMGEGWHNNHHHYMHSTRQGFAWYEFDPSYYIVKTWEKLGLVWDVKEPPASIFLQVKKQKLDPLNAPVGVSVLAGD